VSLRDEFEKLFVHKGESCADPPDKWAWTIRGSFPIEVWSWLEQKLAEAQAETVERCAALVDEIGKRYRWDIPAGATADEIRDLLPDPEWLRNHDNELVAQWLSRVVASIGTTGMDVQIGAAIDRQKKQWELEARLETAERIEGLCIAKTIADAKTLHDYIADLKRQLAALPEAKK